MDSVLCNIRHYNGIIVRAGIVYKKVLPQASFNKHLHSFVLAIKRFLKDLPDLRGVKIKFNDNEMIAGIIEAVERALKKPKGQNAHIVVSKHDEILFVGVFQYA